MRSLTSDAGRLTLFGCHTPVAQCQGPSGARQVSWTYSALPSFRVRRPASDVRPAKRQTSDHSQTTSQLSTHEQPTNDTKINSENRHRRPRRLRQDGARSEE